MNYDIRDIQNTIPHRYPMLLIDKIIDLQEGQRAVRIKNITVIQFSLHYLSTAFIFIFGDLLV